jgi:hypothetical protein
MAQDATGTPTPKGIPKFNTAVDPPSGKGFNAAMDAIDSLLDSYVSKPSGITAGEVPVWNGTTWARSSVTRITTVRPQDLTQDGATTGQVLAWNGSIWAPASAAGASLVTSLPGSPTDGQEVILVDSLSNPTYSWHLCYIAAKPSNKWVFIGGSTLYAEVTTSQSTSSTSYTDLATAGPSITLPYAGIYIVSNGFYGAPRENDNNVEQFMSYAIGASAAVDADACQMGTPSQTGGPYGHNNNTSRTRQKTISSDSTTLTSKYRVSGTATLSFSNRWLSAIPVAIGG